MTSKILIKNKIAIDRMRAAGALLAEVVTYITPFIVEGVSTLELDALMEAEMKRVGLKPECKGYAGYQHATCISINDVIVHGVPCKEDILKSGDFVKIDIVGSFKDYCADMARSFFIGEVSSIVKQLAFTAQRALDAGIAQAVAGKRLHDISATIQQEVEKDGFGIVKHFAGHGIGKSLHEAPDVPNYGKFGTGPVLLEGMTLAIEPMITQHSPAVRIMNDGWTAKTVDGGLAAHVEDTVLITRNGAQILTRP